MIVNRGNAGFGGLGNPGGEVRVYVRELGTEIAIGGAEIRILGLYTTWPPTLPPQGPIEDTKLSDSGGAYTWPSLMATGRYRVWVKKNGYDEIMYHADGRVIDMASVPCEEGIGRTITIYLKRSGGGLPYQCQWCRQGFATQADLEAHIQSAHPKCSVCGARFNTQAELDVHMQSNHPDVIPPGGGGESSGGGEPTPPATSETKKPSTLVLVGIGVLVVGALAFFGLKKKKK